MRRKSSATRPQAWILITLLAAASLLGFQVARTHWSNNCDPGLARFTYMQADPAVHQRPDAAIVDLEVDQPDNGWLVCTNTSIDLYLMGGDNHGIYASFLGFFGGHGWSVVAPATDPHFELFEKDTPHGKWSATVSEQLFWVVVEISDYGGAATTP